MKTPISAKVAIFGLSAASQRYAYLAAKKLLAHGYQNLVGIHPNCQEVLGIPVVASIREIEEPIHTLTMYIGPAKAERLSEDIIHAKPQRIIFNPGSESQRLASLAKDKDIQVHYGCTLVMLGSGSF
ncbi:MAG: CoA-binding protein [Oligoflexus sp.]